MKKLCGVVKVLRYKISVLGIVHENLQSIFPKGHEKYEEKKYVVWIPLVFVHLGCYEKLTQTG